MEFKKSFCYRFPKMDIYNSVIVFVLFGFVCGNHLHGQNGGGVGLIEQSLSLDPFASPSSQASSSASSSASATAGGASSMAASSGGGSSSSSRSEAGRGQRAQLRLGNFDIHMPARVVSRLQDQLMSRNRQRVQTRRKPVRLVVLRPDRRTGQTSTRIHDLLLRQQQRPQQQRGTSLPVQLPGGVINRQVQLPVGSRTASISPRLQRQQLQRQQQLRKRLLQQQQQQQVVPLDEVLGVLRLLLGDIGPSPTTRPPLLPRFGDLFNAQHPATAVPPGLTFLSGQPQLPVVSRVPVRTIINRLHLPTINSFPAASSASAASASAGLGGASSSASASASSGFARPGGAASPASTSFLAANSLTIEGQTPSGDLIIGGPGGTITIGAEVLNGISRTQNTSLVHTEFEEMEAEEGLMGKRMNPQKGLQVASKNGHQPPLVLTGKQSIVPKRPPAGAIRIVEQNNARLVGQSNLPLLVKDHRPLVAHGDQPLVIDGASVGLTLNNTGSGLKTVASGQSVSGTASAASSSSSASSGLKPGGGQNGGVSVTSEAQGKVIHLKGKDTIVVGGVSNGRIDVGNAVSGVKAPGNATFIVGG